MQGWLTDKFRAEVMTALAFLPFVIAVVAVLLMLLRGWLAH